jgi:hypothetical protein
MHHYKQFLLERNIIPWTDGKIETLKYYLSFDYKVMVKIGQPDEWHIGYVTLDENTSHIFSWAIILPIDDYTLFKLSEKRYVPQLHYTVNISKLN